MLNILLPKKSKSSYINKKLNSDVNGSHESKDTFIDI